MRSLIIVLAFSFVSLGQSMASPQSWPPKNAYHILFVGNSLTFYNNLPELVREEAKSRGLHIMADMLAKPNYAIADHWADKKVQEMIEMASYDFVIIQQGPSSQSDGREMLMEYGEKFALLCEAHNAQLVFFMVWPSKHYYHTFDGVITNHTDAAEANNALLCPVGKVWKKHFDTTGDFSYYGADGFHPSLKGSTIAAQIICNTLFKTNTE